MYRCRKILWGLNIETKDEEEMLLKILILAGHGKGLLTKNLLRALLDKIGLTLVLIKDVRNVLSWEWKYRANGGLRGNSTGI